MRLRAQVWVKTSVSGPHQYFCVDTNLEEASTCRSSVPTLAAVVKCPSTEECGAHFLIGNALVTAVDFPMRTRIFIKLRQVSTGKGKQGKVKQV